MEVEELPRANVKRIVKEKITQLSQGESEVTINKDALLAFSDSARIFVHYLSATANDICKESKRQTVNAEVVFKALEEIELVSGVRRSAWGFFEWFQEEKGRETDKKAKVAGSGKQASPHTIM